MLALGERSISVVREWVAYVLIFVGLLLTVAGVRNTQDDFYTLIQGDFIGTNSFIYWLAAIAIVGGLGYVPKLKPISTAFLILILIVLVLKQGTGLFGQLQSALQQSTTTQTQATGTNG